MESEENTCELRETVKQLEAALATTKETVQKLQDALSSREVEITRLRQMLSLTKKERDELRGLNAELVNKQAAVGRKQSIILSSSPMTNSTPSSPAFSFPSPSHKQSFSAPSPPRPHTLTNRHSFTKTDSPLPPLPPPSEGNADEKDTAEESDTEYCDMEDDTKDAKKNLSRRSPSPATTGSPTSEGPPQRKMSQPKPIIRSPGGRPGAHVGAGMASPKKNVAFPPTRKRGLSSISEERNGSPRVPDKTRLPSECDSEASQNFEGSMKEMEDNDLLSSPRRRYATMSLTDFKKSQQSQSVDYSSSEAEDVLDKYDGFENFSRKRSRVSTIASSTGKEYRRKNSRQLKEEAAKLERSPNFRSGGRKFQPLELFSPDMELRIREKICNGIGKKYGGICRATKAAIVIQTAYRQYKLQKRYNEIRKEAIQVRKRAHTMKHPRRELSMIRRNRPQRYQRQLTTALSGNDPLLKAKLRSQELGRESSTSLISSRRHLLVEKTRSVRSLDGDRGEGVAMTDDTENGVVEMETVEMTLDAEEALPPSLPGHVTADSGSTEATDSAGLPTSFSTDVLLTAEGYRRPLSILSIRPSASMDAMPTGHVTRAEDHVIQAMPVKPLPPDVRKRKMNMGIGHFNKKPTRGIQYLVRENVLPDSPQHVATFLANQYGLSKEKIGEFVGEINSEFHMAVLECLLEQMDMKEKPIDEALRDFQILFRMPGEAQKIDKIMQMFALEYYRFNREGVIKSEDAAYILSFAIMMLHTALHNPSVKNRTNKKQWVSMNRGCNDDEDFPESFLLDIYDRISKREFITGTDHTTIVHDIERNLVGYQNSSKLAIPQRRLICRAQVSEIDQLTTRPSFKMRRHRRTLFLFSDQVIICKRRSGDQLEYRGSFTLLDAIAISFETHHYKYGVQIYSSHDEKAIFQCNCDSSDDRKKLLRDLESTISELKEVEKERIAELGTSMTTPQDVEPERRHRMASQAGDLLFSAHLDKPGSVRSRRASKGDYVSGVGDLVLSSGVASNTVLRRTSKSSGSVSPENRTSGGSHESGYDSQRTTPAPSPSPTNVPHSKLHSTPSYSTRHSTPPASSTHHSTPHSSSTHHSTPPSSSTHHSTRHSTPPASSTHHSTPPASSTHHSTPPASSTHHSTRHSTPPASSYPSSASAKRHVQGRPSTTSAPGTLLATPMNPVTRSKSTDQIHLVRVMTITPTLDHDAKARFSSVEDLRDNSKKSASSSASSSPRLSKKKERLRSSDKKRLTFTSPFHIRRGKKDRRGSSPVEIRSSVNGRPRTASATPSPPPSNDLELSSRSVGGRAKSYLLNTT